MPFTNELCELLSCNSKLIPEQHTEVVIKTVTQSKKTPSNDAFEFVGIISNINIWNSVSETNNVMHKVTFSLESTGQQKAAIAILRDYF